MWRQKGIWCNIGNVNVQHVVDLCFSQDAQMTREDVGALWRLADADGKTHRLSKIFQIQSEKNEKKSKEINRILKNN